MRDTFNDRIEPATEEDLMFPDESSEFFNEDEVKEEQKLIKERLNSLVKEREKIIKNTSPVNRKNFQHHRR